VTDTTDTQTTTEATSTEATDAPVADTQAVADTADDATVLGSATADDGAGDIKADSTQAPSPTPVADDAGVPDAYELKLTSVAEDGTETSIDMDPVLVEEATPIFKELGLSNEQANKLTGLMPKVQEQLFKAQNDEFAKVRADWAKEAQADPEIGGKNWTETQRLAARALDHFTGPADDKNEFRKLLNDSGLGNHPVMIRAFRKIGEAIAEDGTFVRNTTEVKQELTREQRNYPEDQPKG
jgi:hypothetical protein